MRRKIYRELVLIRTELRAIREILERKPIIEKSCIRDADNKRNNTAVSRSNADREMLNNTSEKISKFAVAAFVIALIALVVNIMRIALG